MPGTVEYEAVQPVILSLTATLVERLFLAVYLSTEVHVPCTTSLDGHHLQTSRAYDFRLAKSNARKKSQEPKQV